MEQNEHQDKPINELKAMQIINDLFNDLEADEKMRVLDWITKKFGITNQLTQNILGKEISSEIKRNSDNTIDFYESIGDLFAVANVRTEQEKVLLAASYLQLKQNLSDITSREINKELQNMGYKVNNITATISGLINKRPQLMIQTRKEGKSMQAQKKYKVTTEGINTAKTYLIKTENHTN